MAYEVSTCKKLTYIKNISHRSGKNWKSLMYLAQVGSKILKAVVQCGGIIELVYIVLQSVVKPGITGFFKIDLHIKCYIYLS